MLKQTSCHRIISQQALSPLLSTVENELEEEGYVLEVDELPGLDEIFPVIYDECASDDYEPYPPSQVPYNPTDVAFYAHSSGSTGFPKSIPQRHENLLECCNSCMSLVDGPSRWGHCTHQNLNFFLSHRQDRWRPQDHLGCHGAAYIPHDGRIHSALRSSR